MISDAPLFKRPGWKPPSSFEEQRRAVSQWTQITSDHPRPPQPSTRPAKERGFAEKIRRVHLDVKQIRYIPHEAVAAREQNIADVFDELCTAWRAETLVLSSTRDIVMNESYQRIIGLGPDALPLIFRDLEETEDQWFWALKAITRTDPVPQEVRGNTEEMSKIWLEWARENNII